DKAKADIVVPPQQAHHQGNFEEGGKDIEDHEAEQKADAVDPPLDIPGQPAGAPVEVKIQVQGVDVAKHLKTDAAHRPLRYPAEQGVPQLAKHHRGKTGKAVGQQQPQGQGQHRCSLAAIQVVDDMLEHKGATHAGHLGPHQAQQGEQNSQAEFQQVGHQLTQGGPVEGSTGVAEVLGSHGEGWLHKTASITLPPTAVATGWRPRWIIAALPTGPQVVDHGYGGAAY